MPTYQNINYPLGFKHLLRRREKDEPADDDSDGNQESEESDNEDKDEEHTLLMNFRHKFESTLREPARMLAVKDLVINFDPPSVYGQRAGFLKGLLVTETWQFIQQTCQLFKATHLIFPKLKNIFNTFCYIILNEPSKLHPHRPEARAPAGGNLFWKSSAWRRGVVNGVQMCPRAEMYKEVVCSAPLTMNAAFTDIQEQKQAFCQHY